MKTIILILLTTIISNSAFAACDFSTGITVVTGGYLYTAECHRQVGKIKNDLDVATQQVADLSKAIGLKDLALKKSDERVNLWMTSSLAMEDRINKIDELKKKNDFLYFGLGVLATIGAGYMSAQLIHR